MLLLAFFQILIVEASNILLVINSKNPALSHLKGDSPTLDCLHFLIENSLKPVQSSTNFLNRADKNPALSILGNTTSWAIS